MSSQFIPPISVVYCGEIIFAPAASASSKKLAKTIDRRASEVVRMFFSKKTSFGIASRSHSKPVSAYVLLHDELFTSGMCFTSQTCRYRERITKMLNRFKVYPSIIVTTNPLITRSSPRNCIAVTRLRDTKQLFVPSSKGSKV